MQTSPQGPPRLIFVLSPQGAAVPGRSATMGELASVLQRAALDRPVVDRPDLFAAIQQQLGLRLEAARGPVNVLAIDRAERPSEN